MLTSSAICMAQGTEPAASPQATANSADLAALARNAKARKTAKAKKVFTDDDVEANVGPLPRMKMDGADNSDEIVAAIAKYKETHTPEQTEQAVQTWYERYDEMLVATIKENREMQSVGSVNRSNANELCQQSQDYEQCQQRQMAEQRGSRSDQNRMSNNFTLMNRIQNVFRKVRSGLQTNYLLYPWFRIQNNAINGDDL
ncbi:MAG TPA: hypothetical protein VFE61_15170 [Candidatus Sulfotelmatobacter sp.]|nr:hypothetical protein [Candidatus Sulfotelmatobacter sp.]